jgi:hypothetical protein
MTVRETEIIAVGGDDSSASSVSWAAVIAGALGAVATTLILLMVGSGLGLTMVSPWANAGVTATTFAVSSIIWLVIVQWLSSALGGYLAGRLRTRWAGLHGDEVTFRDTAHGFLAWALATIIIAVLLASTVSAIIGGAVQTAATVTSGVAQGAAQGATQVAGQAAAGSIADPTAYFVDTLFRAPAAGASATGSTGATPSPAPAAEGTTPAPTGTAPAPATSDTNVPAATTPAPAPTAQPAPSASGGSAGGAAARSPQDVRAEATRILINGATSDELLAPDKAYLSQLVASQTGMSAADADKRVNDVLAQVQAAKAKAKEAADQARKASATLAILMALSLLVGAFIASVAGIFGGKERDEP